MSFPATFTREKFNSFPILITWLQFSTFLNGIIIGGLDACFQLTDPGEILSSTSSRTHLQINFGKIAKYVPEKVKTTVLIKRAYPVLTSSNKLFT